MFDFNYAILGFNRGVSNGAEKISANYSKSYQAGLGIDWVIGYNEKKHGGTMIFGKFGTDGILGDESYKISGVEYNSGIKYGMWMAQFGFKFFGR